MTTPLWRCLATILVVTTFVGCFAAPPAQKGKKSSATTSGAGSANSTTAGEETTAGDKEAEAAAATAEANKPFKFGDLIEPFTPPALEELEKTVTWKDRPVVDSLKVVREAQAKSSPGLSVAEALKLRNDSPQNNERIIDSLGRVPQQEDEANFDSEINRHAYGDVNSTNPILASSVVEQDIIGLIGFGLFSFDAKMDAFASADTVKSWQSSEDKMYDKVVLRDDLTWSDGTPITAHDVVFSWQAILTSKIPVTAQRSGTDKIKWIEAYDDHTLVFFHKESSPVNDWNLNFSVIPKHAYADHLEKDPTLVNDPYFVKLENNPVSGGAYVISSRTRGQEIVLEARESWYMHEGKQVRDRPYFKTVRFRIRPDESVSLLGLKAGDIDEMQLSPQLWTTQTIDDAFYSNNTKAYGTEWTEFHFLWNLKDPLFADKKVRQALSYAMDYDELIEKLRYNLDTRCNGVFHPTSKWYPQKKLPFFTQDLDKAEELLEEAGWTDSDGDGIRDKVVDGKKVNFEFSLLTVNKPDRIDICTLLKESLDQIQIKCNVKPLEFPIVIDNLQKKKFQAAFGGWGTGTDPYTLENIFKTGEERNYGSYSSKELDKLFAEGLKEFDEAKRIAIYQKVHEILYEDQPYTWLFYQSGFYGFNKSLRGYSFSPRGPYHYGPGFGSIWKPAQ